MTDHAWTANDLSQLMRGYQPACILAAAGELDLFSQLAGPPLTAAEAARRLQADLRALTILLDALAALKILDKQADHYQVPAAVAEFLTADRPGSQLAMLQHQANCLRRWSNLAATVKTGRRPDLPPSIRGEAADYASFIEAMDNVSGPVAPKLVAELQPLSFHHLLDVGGGSGTWTIAFLRLHPKARATIFDLPHVMPQARDRLENAGLADRVTLVPGDFYTDALPPGADLAWVSAIVHQNSRPQNRDLFARIFAALVPGGRILIRDIVMALSRTAPVAGALFAVNMLVATDQGGTFTFEELRDDLIAAGFTEPQFLRPDEGMLAVVGARKP